MGDVITALGLVLGVLIVYLQLQRNHRASLQLQEQHLRNELKLKVYERVGSTLMNTGHSLSKATTQYYSVISSLGMRVRSGLEISPRDLGLDLSERVFTAHTALTGVLLLLEEYEILFAKFGSFRRELSEGCQRLLDVHSRLSTKLTFFLPMRHPNTHEPFGPMMVPTAEELDELERLHAEYLSVCNDLAGYMIDLQIETQNELLSDLFGRQLPPRRPAAPEVKVLRRDETVMAERPSGRLV